VAEKIDILGVNVEPLTRQDAIIRIEDLIVADAPRSVCIVNAHTLNISWKNEDYRRILDGADLVLNDGSGVSWAARMQDRKFLDNMVGTDFVPALCDHLQEKGRSIFLLGAAPGVAESAASILKARYPGLMIAGSHHGYFTKLEEGEVLDIIRKSDPDVLLVALGNPKQEIWIHENMAKLGVPVSIGVGALFDYLSGRVRRAPRWMLDRGIEWVFRLIVEPKRLWRRYIVGNPLFVIRVIYYTKIKKRR